MVQVVEEEEDEGKRGMGAVLVESASTMAGVAGGVAASNTVASTVGMAFVVRRPFPFLARPTTHQVSFTKQRIRVLILVALLTNRQKDDLFWTFGTKCFETRLVVEKQLILAPSLLYYVSRGFLSVRFDFYEPRSSTTTLSPPFHVLLRFPPTHRTLRTISPARPYSKRVILRIQCSFVICPLA